MIDFLYSIPNVYLFLLISSISILISVIGVYMVKRFIPMDLRDRENGVLGEISATICVVYAVLAGFCALYVFDNFNTADTSVENEANAIFDLYEDSRSLTNPAQTKIKENLKDYVNTVLNIEWPSIRNGEEIPKKGDLIIDQIRQNLQEYKVSQNEDSFFLHESIKDIKSLHNKRTARIRMTKSALVIDVWIVIIVGAILSISINYFYGMEFHFHIGSVIAVALIIASMVFLIFAIDNPFKGEFSIKPEAYKSALEAMD